MPSTAVRPTAKPARGRATEDSSTVVAKKTKTRKNVATASRIMAERRGKSRTSSGVPRVAARHASSGRTAFKSRAATIAPRICAAQYRATSTVLERLVTQNPMVMAGLKWPPETWASAEYMTAKVMPCTAAMRKRLGPPAPWRNWSAQMAPAPKKTSANVPKNSAVRRWGRLYMGEIVREEMVGGERAVGMERRRSKEFGRRGSNEAMR